VKTIVAWRMLVHDKGRSVLAIGGILIAILLMFLQLGFYTAVPRGGLLFFDAMRFDLIMTSSAYVYQAQSASFPRRRLYQALGLPEVARATALYQASGRWLNAEQRLVRDVFVFGYSPDDPVFDIAVVKQQIHLIQQPDTILIDTASRLEFGRLDPGRQIEIENRKVTIGGRYTLGVGFVGLGVAITSDLNFVRMFPNQGGLSEVNLGLLTLEPGVNASDVARRLRTMLPPDTHVLTRAELNEVEIKHWMTSTSTGLIFGFGAVVAMIVGLVILHQTLTTQITRQLPQYATLKAIGYTDRDLVGIVLILATILSTASFIPAVGLAIVNYWIIQEATQLPVSMTLARLFGVLAIAWMMSAVSALLALRILRRADPVELF
jgi:putative ABC transport system permease protein